VRAGIATFLLPMVLGNLACAETRTRGAPQPMAAAPTFSVEPAPAPVANAPGLSEASQVAAPNDAGAPSSDCEGQRHLATPAAGFGNDKPFTVSAASVWGESEGDYASLRFEFGTHAARFSAGDGYRGVEIMVFSNAPSLTINPGTYPIPNWENNGPIWSAMLSVSSTLDLGSNARGELVVDEITAAKGKTPAIVRGHVWICVDPFPEFPGPQWIGGTFVATVQPLDPYHRVPARLKVETGSIVATRPAKR